MLFNSYIFILLFFPLCITGYYGFNYFKKYTCGQCFLLVMSLWFYAYFNIGYLAIILSSILVNYGIYVLLYKTSQKGLRKIALIVGLLFNIGLLFFFKYMDFMIENINILFHKEYALLGILLPLGISFFTFQQISFVIDAYKNEIPQRYSFLYYASFVTFFPQLIAGPIVTHDELVPQFLDEKRKRINWDNMAMGIYIFVLGLSKKVLLADTFGKAVTWGYDNLYSLNSTNALLTTVFYTLQIYFDFSAYSDMAIGIGKILNIELPVNFNSPYKSLTIAEFWSRWHITLTRFFTKYIYIPLGGNRKGKVRTYINILIVFLVSGIWHGADWTFVFWGVCHGIFLVITRHFKRFFEDLHPALSWIITFGFVNVMWVFFRADSFSDAWQMLHRIALCSFGEISTEMLACFKLVELEFVLQKTPIETLYPCFLLSAFLILAIFIVLGCKNAHEKMDSFKPTATRMILSAGLLLWCVFSFSDISTFLYYNF